MFWTSQLGSLKFSNSNVLNFWNHQQKKAKQQQFERNNTPHNGVFVGWPSTNHQIPTQKTKTVKVLSPLSQVIIRLSRRRRRRRLKWLKIPGRHLFADGFLAMGTVCCSREVESSSVFSDAPLPKLPKEQGAPPEKTSLEVEKRHSLEVEKRHLAANACGFLTTVGPWRDFPHEKFNMSAVWKWKSRWLVSCKVRS